MGVKVSKIVGLADDIKLNLAAADIRIEAPIPGKAAVGLKYRTKKTVQSCSVIFWNRRNLRTVHPRYLSQ